MLRCEKSNAGRVCQSNGLLGNNSKDGFMWAGSHEYGATDSAQTCPETTSRQNVFDDAGFFRAYLEFREADEGFNTAMEEPAISGLLPDVAGLRVIDLGCGRGKLCRRIASTAAQVIGVDCSERMLALAESESSGFEKTLQYRRCFIEEFDAPDGSIDLVVSSMALHYVENIELVFGKIARWLSPRGVFIFSVEHPIFTAGPREWMAHSDCRKAWAVADYSQEGVRVVPWLGRNVLKHHRTFATILNALLHHGFAVSRCVEPRCDEMTLAARPDAALENQRPAFLIMQCRAIGKWRVGKRTSEDAPGSGNE